VPFSIVFHCEPEEDMDSREFKGEGLRNFAHWFLERLGPARDHGATSEEKASFTVSPFFAKRSPSQRGESGGQKHRGSYRDRHGGHPETVMSPETESSTVPAALSAGVQSCEGRCGPKAYLGYLVPSEKCRFRSL